MKIDLSPSGILCSTAIGKRVISTRWGSSTAHSARAASPTSARMPRRDQPRHPRLGRPARRAALLRLRKLFLMCTHPHCPRRRSNATLALSRDVRGFHDARPLVHSRQEDADPAATLKLVNDAYDDCIASLDEQLGRLFDRGSTSAGGSTTRW